MKGFRPVSKSNPCIGCGKPYYCTVSADGSKYHCRREAAGSVASKQDKNGTPYYVHVTSGEATVERRPVSRPITAPDRAEADALHAVYSELLAKLHLTDSHRAALSQRGLSDQAINEDGYKSLPGPGRARIARELHPRFGDVVLRVPGFYVKSGAQGNYLSLAGPSGIVIPVQDAERRIVALKVRRDECKPDQPKYVYISSSSHDGPGPGAPPHVPLGTPASSEIVRITEGEIKANIAVRLSGMATISVAGVNNWRSAIPVLKQLACKVVRLAFDADAWSNTNVGRQLGQCYENLRLAGFQVEIERWDPGANGEFKGIDDLLVAGRQPDVLNAKDAQLAVSEAEENAKSAEADKHRSTNGYFERGNQTYRTKDSNDGPVPVALCNFTARIVAQNERDDGAETTMYFDIEGTLMDGTALPRITVPAADFAAMNWVVQSWGTRAVVFAGAGAKDHLRAAIQILSGIVPSQVTYQHTGWRKILDQWTYLHGGGAIGPNGPVEATVELPDALAGYCLPDSDTDIREAIQASLRIWDLGPDRLTVPLHAAVYRSVLGDCDFGVHISGPTGTFKSEVAALMQQHFGRDMDGRHLPGTWSSTGNALEALAFTAKDALFVVDDFCPTGSSADVQRYHREADRLFRGQGNRSGRQRMRADATLRPTKPPRGLILSTGEDTPRGQSLKARLLTLEAESGDFGPQPPAPNPALTACQQHASAGIYARMMAGFIKWVASQYDSVRAKLRSDRELFREQVRGKGMHARTPNLIADLLIGLKYLLEFAESVGAITAAERQSRWKRGLEALVDAGNRQADQIASNEPAGMFERLLFAAIAAGDAHVVSQDGTEPEEPLKWGWREDSARENDSATRYRPAGKCVGWLHEGQLYLEPDASYAAVQEFARRQNDSLSIGAHTLRRRLREKGFLVSTDEARGKITVRRVLQGVRREVLNLRHSQGSVSITSETGPFGPQDEMIRENGPNPWADSSPEDLNSAHQPAHEVAHDSPGNNDQADPMGRMGRSQTGTDAAAASQRGYIATDLDTLDRMVLEEIDAEK